MPERLRERITRMIEPKTSNPDADRDYVHKEFTVLCQYLASGADQALVDTEWQKIHAAYASPERYYHTLNGLVLLLQNLHAHVEIRSERFELIAAAFYTHLYLYQGVSTNTRGNTASGADEGAVFLRKLGMREDFIDRFKSRIMATRDYSRFLENDPAGALFVDLERMMLVADTHVYKNCVENIRLELKNYSKAEYRLRRLRSFVLPTLQRARIFATDSLPDMYEGMARRNLMAEKQAIESKLTISSPSPV